MRLIRLALIIFTFFTILSNTLTSGAETSIEENSVNIEDALLRFSDLHGGICVILGFTDVELPLSISRHGFIVHSLYQYKDDLDKARKAIDKRGIYGRVSADLVQLNRLPYSENLINIIIVGDYQLLRSRGLSIDELFRVLTPRGTLFIRYPNTLSDSRSKWTTTLKPELDRTGLQDIQLIEANGRWLKAIKPWPSDIDEWTHFLHGPDGNPVANDSVVAPPKHYQWISEPLWLRSHESDSSIKTLVTARGRLFYIADEAPISLLGDHSLPDKWFLIARDAFNGVLLWKIPIENWGWRVWKPSWFTPRPGDIPLNIQKRLVAVGNKVYVTLGYRAAVSELDARTGEVLNVFDKTDETTEILYLDGSLILTVLTEKGSKIAMVDTQGGKRLWTSQHSYTGTTTDYYRFRAMHGSVTPAKVDPTLNTATDGKVVALLDGEDVVCLDFETGREKWRSPFPLVEADYKAGGINAQRTLWTGTLIVRDGVVVHASPNQMAGYSADSGKILWTRSKKYLGHLWYEWKDVFIIDGLVWTWSKDLEKGKLEGDNKNSVWPVSVNGYDLHTGQLREKVPLGNIFKTHHHHRCYRNKATLNYILASRRGTEYIDLKQGKHTIQNWVRGTCHMGMMPANGLQYAPPHPCVCYIDEKLNGFNALAPALPSKNPKAEYEAPRSLEKGPAFKRTSGKTAGDEDWPAFRHDNMRSGATKAKISETLALLWNVRLGRNISPPIVVGERLFVALIDEHNVVALDTDNGQTVWKFFAGARIDSAPTYYKGLILFGSADGFVYCLTAFDGKLKWRFRAAPQLRCIGAFNQLESAWPVHGSVLVLNGTAYFASGRSSHLDGGIWLYGLDAVSGQICFQTRLQGPSYDVDNISQNYQLPMGVLPDILMGEKNVIYMRDHLFNTKLEEQKHLPLDASRRIYTKSGLIDNSYFKRAAWSFGSESNYGRLIVHDEQTVYFIRMFDTLRGLDPNVYFTPGQKGYLLFAVDKKSGKQNWSERISVRVKTMVTAGKSLLTAGPPDIIDPKDPLGVFEGRKGGVLNVFNSLTGEKLAEYRLDSPPVFNGAAVANGKLYISMEDGSLSSFGSN